MIIILQIIVAILFLIAGMVFTEFVKTRDGELRKIMVAYFACEMWKNIVSIGLLIKYGDNIHILAQIALFTMVFPKAIVKIWLYIFLIKKK